MVRSARVAAQWALVCLPVGLLALYLLRGIDAANAGYYLSRRLPQTAALITAGVGLGAAATVFQTLTNNRLLSPSILGIDALYVLLQTAVVFVSGSGAAVIRHPFANYAVSLAVITLLTVTLIYSFAFSQRHGYAYLLLAGVVLQTGFRSAASFLQMLIDPNEFAVVQDSMFASIQTVDSDLIPVAAAVMIAALAIIVSRTRRLDVIALGREIAQNLGVTVAVETRLLMAAAVVLVSSSTALVGPLPLLGLVAANVARSLTREWHHATLIPLAAGAACAILLLAQLTGVWGVIHGLPVSSVTRLIGAALLLALLVRGERR